MESNLDTFFEIEKPAGPPDIEPVDAAAIDECRRAAYLSYEEYLRGRIAELDAGRSSQWKRDYRSVQAYAASIAPQRERLKQMLGFWQEPRQRTLVVPRNIVVLMEHAEFTARRFSLEVLPGLSTYAVELVPKRSGPLPGLLVQHGYAGTPELACGLTPHANDEDYSYRSLGLRAAARGYYVVATLHPSGYGSTEDAVGSLPGFERYGRTYGKNRLHRLATLCGGRTLFGLDMMASSRGIDYLCSRPEVDAGRIGMYGLSQGGQSALFLPALDERIEASVSSAFFNSRMVKLIGPHRATSFLDSPEEDKFFTQVISHFSDSDIVSLIAPRAFAVEAGLHDGSVDFEKARDELELAREHYYRLRISDRIEFIPHAEGHVSATARAFEFLEKQLAGMEPHAEPDKDLEID